MASLPIGRSLEPFDPQTEDFEAYAERLEQYLLVNDVSDKKKQVAFFLTVVGSSTYQALRDLLAPDTPASRTLEELLEVLKGHYKPARLVIAERFNFHRRHQQPGESAAKYMVELRRLIGKNMSFWAISKRRIKGPVAERALEISQAMETVEKGAKDFKEEHQDSKRQETETAAINVCHKCKRVGHLARACRSSGSKKHRVTEPQEQEYRLDYIGVLKGISTKRVWIEVELNGIPLKMELDTGASVSLVSKKTWREKLGSPPLTKRKIVLRAYSGHRLHVIGETTVDVNAGSQRHKSLPLVVVEGEEAPLFGRNWLVQGQSPPTGARGNPPALDELLKRYDVIFKQQLGKIKDLKATIRVQSEATPKFFKHRPVAYALRERVEQELERLVAIGVIEPISHSEWAAPIVPVIKNNGDVRMCGDFKVTVNQCLDIEQYPLPKIDELYANLQGGERFTILDLSEAFLQMDLDEGSRKYLVVNTHRGLFRL
eukprot:Em0002g1106a